MPPPDDPPQDEPQQITLMRQMVELSIERTTEAKKRTAESLLRTTESKKRTQESLVRTRESKKRTRESRVRTRESLVRTTESEKRSEMSAERSYMNAERTLSVWIRTGMATMVVGIAIDRFRLVLLQHPDEVPRPDTASSWIGAGLVALGVLMVVVPAVRFLRYAASYRRSHELPHFHGAFMAPAFALLITIFGIILLVLLLVIKE